MLVIIYFFKKSSILVHKRLFGKKYLLFIFEKIQGSKDSVSMLKNFKHLNLKEIYFFSLAANI